jgi:spore coat polysaccharide biosynthesis predicted glycosyltransferase SpsG
LGLPAVTLILADNQRALAQRMDAEGLTLAVEAFKPGFARRFVEAFERLAGDETLRRSMSSRLAALCDGLGVERIAEAMSRPPGRHGS